MTPEPCRYCPSTDTELVQIDCCTWHWLCPGCRNSLDDLASAIRWYLDRLADAHARKAA